MYVLTVKMKKKEELNKSSQAKKSKENDEFAAALAEAGVIMAEDYPEEKKVRNQFDYSL